jgi:hypothetical protein
MERETGSSGCTHTLANIRAPFPAFSFDSISFLKLSAHFHQHKSNASCVPDIKVDKCSGFFKTRLGQRLFCEI